MRLTGIRLTHGQRIFAPASVRPSAVRARKALFDMLAHRLGVAFEQKIILDVFAGAGTLGFEALLRGAAMAIFIDKERDACVQIMKNSALLGVKKKCFTIRRNVIAAAKRPRFLPPADLVFADPPYRSALVAPALTALAKGGWIKKHAHIIVETQANQTAPQFDGFTLVAEHCLRPARFLILANDDEITSPPPKV